MTAAERWDRKSKIAGHKNGAIGHVGLEVLRELMRIVDYKTGRLEPSLAYLQRRLKRSRAAIVDALARLRLVGFVDWLRRYEEADTAGNKGPQIRQATNAYRVQLPVFLEYLLCAKWVKKPGDALSDDMAERKAKMLKEMMAFESGVSPALDRLGATIHAKNVKA
jgi:hypothetical protein